MESSDQVPLADWIPTLPLSGGTKANIEAYSMSNADLPIILILAGYLTLSRHFPQGCLLCIIWTNYRTSSVGPAVGANRLFSISWEGSRAYDRNDGWSPRGSTYIDGAHRTVFHRCHGGYDSLVTAREF